MNWVRIPCLKMHDLRTVLACIVVVAGICLGSCARTSAPQDGSVGRVQDAHELGNRKPALDEPSHRAADFYDKCAQIESTMSNGQRMLSKDVIGNLGPPDCAQSLPAPYAYAWAYRYPRTDVKRDWVAVFLFVDGSRLKTVGYNDAAEFKWGEWKQFPSRPNESLTIVPSK